VKLDPLQDFASGKSQVFAELEVWNALDAATPGSLEKATFHSHRRFLAPNNVYSRHTLISPEEIRKMPDEEWINTLEDGRKVKFIYQELPEDGAFITAQLAGNEVVYSVILTKAGNPLSREDVESHFEGELSKK
jgi:hypothetical protein